MNGLDLAVFQAGGGHAALLEKASDVQNWTKSVARIRAIDRLPKAGLEFCGNHRRHEVHAPAFVGKDSEGLVLLDQFCGGFEGGADVGGADVIFSI